jgi:hypothetical protein
VADVPARKSRADLDTICGGDRASAAPACQAECLSGRVAGDAAKRDQQCGSTSLSGSQSDAAGLPRRFVGATSRIVARIMMTLGGLGRVPPRVFSCAVVAISRMYGRSWGGRGGAVCGESAGCGILFGSGYAAELGRAAPRSLAAWTIASAAGSRVAGAGDHVQGCRRWEPHEEWVASCRARNRRDSPPERHGPDARSATGGGSDRRPGPGSALA